MNGLSELEGAALGVVRLRGPVTAYAVRAEFARSRSSHWSGSAGAIYPLLARLSRRGLLRSRGSTSGRRACRLFETTPAGDRALRRWIGAEVDTAMAAVSFDPIRTRVLFFGTIRNSQRQRFLRSALRQVSREMQALRQLRAELRKRGDRWGARVVTGAVGVLRARRAWLSGLTAARAMP